MLLNNLPFRASCHQKKLVAREDKEMRGPDDDISNISVFDIDRRDIRDTRDGKTRTFFLLANIHPRSLGRRANPESIRARDRKASIE
ncbi:hypothetical protein TWF569_011913 [Orbilia oligospora]|nr:hypothetical protein TWF569_011913 [Orbilia oligospora]